MSRACVLLGALLLVLVPAARADDDVETAVAKLRLRIKTVEADMAAVHKGIQRASEQLERLKAAANAQPENKELQLGIRLLEKDVQKLQRGLTAQAAEVARLKVEVENLEQAAKSAAPPTNDGKSLWGPPVEHPVAADLTKKFAKYNGAAIAAVAAGIVRTQALADLRPAYKTLLTGIRGRDVLVVKGSFDKIELAVNALRVPCTRVRVWDLYKKSGAVTFDGYKAILWNCGEALPKPHRKKIGKALRAFVQKGGFLYTTDWAVVHVLPLAFPGKVGTTGVKGHLPEMVVPITPVRGARDHLYLRGVLAPSTKVMWWLEQAAFDIKLGKSFRGTQLLEAEQLRDAFRRRPDVTIVFAHGGGRVLHTIGHAYQHAGNLAGAIGAQRLMLNFVLMAQLERAKRPPDGLGAKK